MDDRCETAKTMISTVALIFLQDLTGIHISIFLQKTV